MKLFSFSRIAIALAVATAAAVSGCGTSNNGPIPGGFGAPGMPGYPGFGGGGCLPVNMPIGFTGSGIPMNSTYFNAGMIPGYPQPFGSMIIGGAAAPQPVYGGMGQIQGSGIDGTINISVQMGQYGQPYPTTGYPTTGYPTTGYPSYGGSLATLTGTLSISPIQQQQIMTAFGGYAGGYNPYGTAYPTGYPTTGYPTTQPYPGTMPMPGMPNNGMICASGIAIGNAHVYSSGLPNLAADVYIYMNNTQHGYTLRFY